MPDRILSADDVSQRLKVSLRSLERWRITGDGPPFVRIGLRRIGYPESACEAWVARRTYDHRAAELAAQPAAA
jgi:predicted DNA-binding transcriptional regulator AlpA